jgi:hypothetical protein
VRFGPSQSQEGNCILRSLCSVNCCFFILVIAMAQAMASPCSVASKFAWKLSSESRLFASFRSYSSCSNPIGFFLFLFNLIFTKLEQFNGNKFWSHVLTLIHYGSPSLSPGARPSMDG